MINIMNIGWKNFIYFMAGFLVVLFLWFVSNNYYRYVSESKELKSTIKSYNTTHSLAEKWIELNTTFELDKLLDEIINKRNSLLLVFPPNNYIGAKNVFETIDSILLKNNLNYNIDISDSFDNGFYYKIYFDIDFNGDLNKIKKALSDLDVQYPLIRWLSFHSDNNNFFSVRFSFYAYNDESYDKEYSYINYLRSNVSTYENYRIESRLFPFSFWVNGLQKDILELYRQEVALSELGPSAFKIKEKYFKYEHIKKEFELKTRVFEKLKEKKEIQGKQLNHLGTIWESP